jgi:hypothetical protein
LNSYSFDIITHAEREKIIHENLQKMHKIEGLKHKEVIKLKQSVVTKLVWFPKESTKIILAQMLTDLRSNVPNVKRAVVSRLKETIGDKEIPPEKVELRIGVDDEDDVHVESNLSDVFGLQKSKAHEIIGWGLLAIGGINKRIETMRAFSALTGFRENELPLFENKLSFIVETVDPKLYETRAKGILSWSQFPDLIQALLSGKVSIEKLLQIRESRECIEFRNWLWSTNKIANGELKERLNSLLPKVSLEYSSKKGKNIRWFVTSGLGLIPGIGLLGTAVSALDHFLLEDVLKENGVVTFLGKTYPSIFTGK